MAKQISPSTYIVLNKCLDKVEREHRGTNFYKKEIRSCLNRRKLTPEHAFILMKRVLTLEYTTFGITPNEEEITKKAIEELNKEN